MEYGLVIGVIAFLAVAGFYGYARGMVKIVMSMVAMIVTLVLATVLTVPVAKVVKSATSVYDNMYETVYETVKENNIINEQSLSKLDLPKQVEDKILQGDFFEEHKDVSKAIEEFQTYVATQITNAAFNAGVFLILLIVIYIIVKIAITMLDFVAKLPLLKEVNKVGGFAIGLVYGFVVIWAACLVFTACSSKPWAKEIFAAINGNSFLSFLYNNNLITWLVTKVM